MNWRDAPSIVGRGDTRCGICQDVIEDQNEAETFEGMRCHSECVDAEEQREPSWWPDD